MRSVRLFSPEPLSPESELTLGAFEANYVARVLRLRRGDTLMLFDGSGGEYDATIVETGRRELRLAVGAHGDSERESSLDIVLAQCISKGDRMDFAVQKATELGVAAIVPLLAARSQTRLDERRAAQRREHWRGVAISACQQCGRNRVPRIAPPTALDAWLASGGDPGLRLIALPGATERLPAAAPVGTVTLLIGPEGGFDGAEADAARAAGFVPLSLGPRILRTETAAIVAVALLQSRFGDIA